MALRRLGPLCGAWQEAGLTATAVFEDPLEVAVRVARRLGWQAGVAAEDPPYRTSRAYRLVSVPTAILVDRAGTIAGTVTGWDHAALVALIGRAGALLGAEDLGRDLEPVAVDLRGHLVGVVNDVDQPRRVIRRTASRCDDEPPIRAILEPSHRGDPVLSRPGPYGREQQHVVTAHATAARPIQPRHDAGPESQDAAARHPRAMRPVGRNLGGHAVPISGR
jgi:hypothetical protein